MSASLVQYGGFTFERTRVSVQEDFLYDTDERTLLGTSYSISVSGIVSADSTDSFRTKLRDMRAALSKNGQRFLLHDSEQNVTILDLDPTSGQGDAAVHDWGPHVHGFTFSELAGLRSAHYSWRATAFRKDCSPIQQGVAGILSISRTYSYSIDVAGYATRSLSGTLKCTRQASPADQYRSMVDPGLPTRFRRIQQQFSQSPDARTLTFNVVDQEVYATLPQQIADGEATWGVKVADLGARVFYVLNGRFRGGPTTPKGALFGAVLALVQSRFPLADPSLLFEEASVDDAVFDNEISFSILASGVIGTLTNQTQIFNALFKGMMTPPPGSSGLAFLPSPYGDLPGTPHIARMSNLSDACSSQSQEIASSPLSVEPSRGDGMGIPGTGGGGDSVPQDGVSQAHLTTPFAEYTERIGYHFDYKVSRMDRKDDGVTTPEPEFSQSCRPSVTAVQSGYMKVYAKSALEVPAPPSPIWPSGVLRDAWVEPDCGQPVADGVWRLFTVHWRYVSEWKGYVGQDAPGDGFVGFPVEPRLGPGNVDQGSLAGKAPWLTGGLTS